MPSQDVRVSCFVLLAILASMVGCARDAPSENASEPAQTETDADEATAAASSQEPETPAEDDSNRFYSEPHHLSVRFPEGWSAESGQSGEMPLTIESEVGRSRMIMIFTAEVPQGADPMSFLKGVRQARQIGAGFEGSEIVEKGTTSINGTDAEWQIISYRDPSALDPDAQQKSMSYSLLTDGRVYFFGLVPGSEDFETSRRDFEALVKSFRAE